MGAETSGVCPRVGRTKRTRLILLSLATWFGPKKGLNGRWGWFNPQTKENLEQKVGNFYGIFEIVPKPETNAIYASSFIYRRCAEPLPSLCPAENPHVNVTAKGDSTKVARVEGMKAESGAVVATVVLEDGLVGASTGDQLKIAGSSTEIGATVFQSLTGTKKNVQLDAAVYDAKSAYAVGDFVFNAGKLYKVTTAVEESEEGRGAFPTASVSEVTDLVGATVTRG